MATSIQERIKAARALTGLSQIKFAAEYGLPRRTLEAWEAGDRKPPEYVVNLLEKAVKESAGMNMELDMSTTKITVPSDLIKHMVRGMDTSSIINLLDVIENTADIEDIFDIDINSSGYKERLDVAWSMNIVGSVIESELERRYPSEVENWKHSDSG